MKGQGKALVKRDNPTTAIARPIEQSPEAPVAIYLSSLAPSGRPSMRSGLRKVATLIKAGASESTLPWHGLRYVHTQALRAALIERYDPRTVNRMLSAVRGVLKAAWNLRQMDTDDYHRAIQIKSVSTTSLPPSGRALEVDELEKLFATATSSTSHLGARDAALIVVLYAGGLRRQEASALDVGDFTPKDGALIVRRGKGAKSRTAYIPEDYRELVTDWQAIRRAAGAKLDAPMFVRADRFGLTETRLGRKGVHHVIDRLREQSKLEKFSAHDLRRSFGTHLLDAGADILMVQELMGHADVKTTKIYDRRGEAGKKTAIERLPRVLGKRKP